jgi:hypothetical protein
MNWRVWTVGLVLVALLVVPLAGPVAGQEPPTQEEVKAAIAKGVEWLAEQQDDDGFWGYWRECAVTALAVKKLEHHAVDPKWGWGLDSPFDETYPYREHVEKGLHWLLANCADDPQPISMQPAGDPDSNGNGLGVRFHWGTYETSIALMAICEAVELDRVVEDGPLDGWTYEQVAQDTMDWLAFGQNDANWERGGWGYYANQVDWSDQSNSGYAALGLGFAEAASPLGCGFTIPQFVKDELEIWIGNVQNLDGGSAYTPGGGSNILRTGNLLQQMDLVGDAADTPRVQNALGFMAAHWYDIYEPGWRGSPACYQATFTAMKGFTSLGLYHEFGDPPISWQEDFETVLLEQQEDDGSWPQTCWDRGPYYGDPPILSTIWALLTLQKVAPPPAVPVDIHPTSCPNPLNVGKRGVLPVAILGTEDFDVGQIDPASVELEGVSPLRWAWEDVATPFEPFLGKEDCFADCTEEGPDGYLDLTLKFEAQEVVAALGEVEDGDCLVLHLTGNLMEEYHGGPFVGEDVVWILKKGKK